MFAQRGLLLTELSPQPGVDLMMRKVLSQVKYSFTVVLRQDATAVKSRHHKSQENHTVLLELCFLEFSRPRPLCKCSRADS